VFCGGVEANLREFAGVQDFPFHSMVITFPLCEEQRRYRLSEVSLDRRIIWSRSTLKLRFGDVLTRTPACHASTVDLVSSICDNKSPNSSHLV
jgi:hypothetical protein